MTTELIRAVRSLLVLQQPPVSRYGVATRAALSIGVPCAVLAVMGYPEVGLQAAAGAFTALYAAGASTLEQAKVLPVVGLGLFICAVLGVCLTAWPWVFAAGLVILAVVSAALCMAFRLGPPGAVFFVLVYGLSGNITRFVDGERANEPVPYLLALGMGILFSYLLAVLPLVLPRVRREPSKSFRELFPGPWLGGGEQLLVLRIAIVSLVGTIISTVWLDPVHAYWTVAAGVAVIGLTATRSYALARGLHRMFGTVLGAGVYLALVPLGTSPWVVIPLIMLLQFIIELVVVRNYALALMFVTPLVLLVTSAALGEPNLVGTALERILDTAAGALLAMATGFMHRKQ